MGRAQAVYQRCPCGAEQHMDPDDIQCGRTDPHAADCPYPLWTYSAAEYHRWLEAREAKLTGKTPSLFPVEATP